MFYYFGRKARLAGKYPAPQYETVIEPFAGSAAFSLTYQPMRAILLEKDQRIVDLWDRLCRMSEIELLNEPDLVAGSMTDDLWHMLAMGSEHALTSRSLRVSTKAVNEFRKAKKVAASLLKTALRYEYKQGDYTNAPDIEATWFIDPPYQKQN